MCLSYQKSRALPDTKASLLLTLVRFILNAIPSRLGYKSVISDDSIFWKELNKRIVKPEKDFQTVFQNVQLAVSGKSREIGNRAVHQVPEMRSTLRRKLFLVEVS
jgi:hypothetical protein